MSQILFASPVVLTALAFFFIWNTKRLQNKFRIFNDEENKDLTSKEWWSRTFAHIATFTSLLPIPFLLLLPVAEVTAFTSNTFGAAGVSGATVAILKLILKVKFSKLLGADIGWINQLALATLGFTAGTLFAVMISLISDPALKSALLQTLSK